MKLSLIIIFAIITIPGSGQESPSQLARRLTEGHSTEMAKMKSIFRWITDNISYRVKNRQPVIGAASKKNFTETEVDNSPLLPLNERVAERVLNSRVAVCDGYARLFTTLCDYAGIRSEVIVGYARSGTNKPVSRFAVNHYWNAVCIDGKWHLLDATWASGYLSPGGDEFIRDFDPDYFMVLPEKFIKDHYPDDPRWTLLEDSRIPDEFRRSPFKQKSFSKYHFTSYSPASGIIDAAIGDTLHFRLETAAVEAGRQVSPDLLIDSAIFNYSPSWVFLQPEPKTGIKTKLQYHYVFPVTSPGVEWLYLMYNNDLVLRYKVNVR